MTTIKKHFAPLLCLLLFVALFNGCHKKDTLGKAICPTSSFKITTPFALSLSSVNSATDKLNIVAGFSEEIEWWITIKGKTSGATKSYTGKTDSLNIDYYGNSETDVFFQAEECEVKFEMACGQEGSTKTFTYTAMPTIHNPDFGYLLTNFDGYPTTGAYSTTGGWGNDAVKEVIKVNNITTDPSPQGGKAMMYRGAVKDSFAVPQILLWYYGGFSSSISGFITSLKNSGVTDPERIYLNMYVRGYATDFPNTQLQLSLEGLKESVETGSAVAESKNYNLSIDWDGWKMVSIKFSEFVNLHEFADLTNAATSSTISSLGMGLGAGPEQNNKAKLLLDFIIITVDAPYKEVQKRQY